MPRVIGIDIPNRKRLVISLTHIYGIGKTLAKEVVLKLGLDEDMPAGDLSEDDIGRLNALLTSEYVVEGDLRRDIQNNIRRLMGIQCYRGIRHRVGLPVRGQRTRTNSRTRKGKRKTIANKKI
jgi:small subunit ribosomal protein S13